MFRKLMIANRVRQEVKLEEGTTKQHSEDTEQRRFIWVKHLLEKTLDRQYFLGDWIFVMICMLAIDTDTAFLRIPEINGAKMCILLNEGNRTGAIVRRSIVDFLYIIYSLYPVLVNKDKEDRKYRCLFFVVDIIAVLPIPQVLVTFYAERFLFLIKLFNTQLGIKAMRMFPLLRKRKLRGWAEQIIFAFCVFFYTFVETGGVVGSLWYFFAVKEETICWTKALRKREESRSRASFYCRENSSGNYSFLGDLCPMKADNKDMYDFGIFADALKSGIVKVDTKNGWRKSVYCWRWGLQSISGLGQGLQPTSNAGQNIFVLSITLAGVLLLIVSIGLVQIVIEGQITKFTEMISKSQELEQWKPFKKFTKSLQWRIKKAVQKRVHKTADVDVENLLNCGISERLKLDIKRELCLPLLKKVEEFRELTEDVLEGLCACAKPVTFAARSHIVRQGDPVNEMIFVVQGEIWTYKTNNNTETTAGPDCFLEDNFSGKELPALLQNSSSFNLPTSNTAIQALTKVEAFALGFRDLKNVFSKQRTQPSDSQNELPKNSPQSSGCLRTFVSHIRGK